MATRNERKLEVRITSEAKQFDRGFQQASRSAQSFGKQMDTASQTGVQRFNGSMDVASQRLRGFLGIAAAALAGGALVRWAGQARESANNLSESINAVSVVAGEGADQILAFGERAAESAGLANSAANQLVVPIVSMLRNFGFSAEEAGDAAVVLAQRAADMASVFNVEVSQALEAIQAALRGESDPIERFGASISAARVESFLLAEGLVESKGAITDADKVLGRYNLILADTARVAGDFAATADEDANKTRIFQARVEDLQAEVGKNLLPLFGALIDAGEDLLPTLDSLGSDVLPVLVEGFVDFVAGVKAIAETIGGLPDGVKVASAALLGLLGTAKLLFAHPVIAGLGLVALGIVAIGDAARDEKEQVDELRVAIETLIDTGSGEDLFETVKQDIRDLIADSDELREGFETLGIPLNKLADFVIGDPQAIRDVNAALERFQELATTDPGRLDPAVIGDSRVTSGFVEQLRVQQDRLVETTRSTEELRRAEQDLNDTGELADKMVRQRVNSEAELNRERGTSVDLTEEQVAALEEEQARTAEVTDGVRQLAEAYARDLNKAANDYLTIFEGVEEVDPVQGVDQLLANVEGRIEVVSGFLAGIQRLRNEGLFELSLEFEGAGISAQNVAEMEAVIADIDSGGARAFELEETLAAAKEETGRITEHMGLELARSKMPLLTEAQRLGVEIGEAIAGGVENVAMSFRIRVGAASVTGGSRSGSSNPNQSIMPMASGGRFRPGETLLVGEYRPEVVQFDQGGMVHPSVDQFAASMLRPDSGRAPVTNNWTIPIEGTGDPQVDAARAGAVVSVLQRMESR